jgi:hypothetical protein
MAVAVFWIADSLNAVIVVSARSVITPINSVRMRRREDGRRRASTCTPRRDRHDCEAAGAERQLRFA